MNFGALGGQNRADIVQVIPRTNLAYIFNNKCPGSGSGGDDPNMGDPQLQAYTSTGCGSGVCPQAVITLPDATRDSEKQAAITLELQYILEWHLKLRLIFREGYMIRISSPQIS